MILQWLSIRDVDMMEKFAQVYPEQGLLLVVDELL